LEIIISNYLGEMEMRLFLEINVYEQCIMEENKYICEPCQLTTKYKNVYEKHLTSKKHTDRMNAAQETSLSDKHLCDKCNKSYTTNCGLWKHRKKCGENNTGAETTVSDVPETVHVEIQSENITTTIENVATTNAKTTPIAKKSESDIMNETLDEQRARITVHIIQTILQHMDITRDELNSIIDEVYLEREIAKIAEYSEKQKQKS